MNPNWRDLNRKDWDERVDLHLEAESYDLGPLRSGRGELTPIEEAEIGSVGGLHILHLQCHFGRDTLTLAQRGAQPQADEREQRDTLHRGAPPRACGPVTRRSRGLAGPRR